MRCPMYADLPYYGHFFTGILRTRVFFAFLLFFAFSWWDSVGLSEHSAIRWRWRWRGMAGGVWGVTRLCCVVVCTALRPRGVPWGCRGVLCRPCAHSGCTLSLLCGGVPWGRSAPRPTLSSEARRRTNARWCYTALQLGRGPLWPTLD